MDELALELNLKPGWRFLARILVMFTGGVCCLNAAQVVSWYAFPDFYPVLHAGSWGGWFVWQGLIFPHARERSIVSAHRSAYAATFYCHIWPGVCWGLSQMTLPAVLGLRNGLANSPVRLGVGTLITALGAGLMASGFRTIGIARAGFLSEYRQVTTPICHSNVYALMRHPLFVGGALVSVGSTLSLGSHAELVIAAVNMAILPVYQVIEDRRLTKIFGEHYADYAHSVGGIIPRFAPFAWILSQGKRTLRLMLPQTRDADRFTLGSQNESDALPPPHNQET